LSHWEEEAFWRADVAVVGAGLVGLSLAAELLERAPGLRVIILERGLIPMGASTKNAGFLCLGSPSELCRSLREVGEAQTVTMVGQRASGLRRLRERLGDEAIGYEALGGYELILEPYEWVLHELDRLNILLRDVVGADYALLWDDRLSDFQFGERVKHLIYLPHEASVHSGFLVRRLWQYVAGLGALIMTGAEVEAWTEAGQSVTIKIKDTSGRRWHLSTRLLALCTNALAPLLTCRLSARPARGQILITEPIEDLPWKGVFHFEEGYFYFRSVGKRILFGGGRHHDFVAETTDQFETTEKIKHLLESYLQTIIIPWREVRVERWWAGIMGFREPPLPKVVWEGQQVVSVFACNGMGVALSSVIAQHAADEVLGRQA